MGTGLTGGAVLVFSLALALVLSEAARGVAASAPSRTVNLVAGEIRVIEHVRRTGTLEVRVLDNPHALVVHCEEPGKLVLLAAERGSWKLRVPLDDGTWVNYQVNVSAHLDPHNRIAPGAGPAPVFDGYDSVGATGVPDAASVSSPAIDAGAGPVAAAAGTWTVASGPGGASGLKALPAAPGQAASAGVQSGADGASVTYRSDPSVIAEGGSYDSPSVSGGPNYLPADGFLMMAGTSEVVDFVHRLRRISIANSSIADVQVITPYQLNLIAHKPGFTTLAVWDEQGHYEERQVRIDPTGKQQVLLNCIVAELNRNNIENQGIDYSMALARYGVSLVGLAGAVATPYSQQASSSGATMPTVLPPGGNLASLLLSQNLTYGLAAQNSNLLTQTLFQFLEQHNLARVLAEPHLLANSGEKAKFLSGGEIPIVVAQALNTSIVFKEFGTKVMFVPTVVGSNEIELLVKPEVSQPDYTHGVELFGFTVPAFVTRRAETLVRLRDGQTLIVAGLILRDKTEVVQKVPYLGDIPYLGGLFRNTNWQDNQSDLVMAVTPQIVRPLPAAGRVFVATERGPLSAEEIRTQRLSTPSAARPRF